MPAAPRTKILIPHAAIRRRVRAIARQINGDFHSQPVHLIGVLSGACIFLADLARELELDVSIDFLAAASYGRKSNSSGQVRLIQDLNSSIEGLNVILVEDILDTGLTLDYLRRILLARRPKSLRIVVLLKKNVRRLVRSIEADYVGFEIPNRFVVGYGLDWAGHFRHLRDVCVLSPGPSAGRRASASVP